MAWPGWSRIRSFPCPLRVLAFLALLASAWLPLAAALWVGLPGLRELLWIPLYLGLLVLLWIWGRWVRQCPFPYVGYGVVRSSAFYWDLVNGTVAGLLGLVCFFQIEASLGWLHWQPISLSLLMVTLITGLGLGLGVAWVEELFFRGWLLNELQDDYGPSRANGVSSLIFAVAHFIKPWEDILRTWPQFPGLVVMGAVLLLARRSSMGQLGLALGLHAGWIWGITLINTVKWVEYTGLVPAWVTGVDNNPLAGAVGLLFLGTNAVGIWLYTRQQGHGA